MVKKILLNIVCLALLCLAGLNISAGESLPVANIVEINDLSQLSLQAETERKLIMLEISASYCDYCRKLEENIIKPMIRSGDYDAKVLIRRFEIDGYAQLKDFNGIPVSNDELAKRWDVKVTPTLIFLNSQNQEVSKRIIGVNSLDYFGSYVDKAIDTGLATIR